MAVSYKGLVIKFGAKSTELQKALKNISADSRKTASDLKDINKTLKIAPGNTELLSQKVKTLNAAYQETEQRLDAYKQALSTLEGKKQSGAKLTEEEERQYDSLKRSIIECESQLDSYGEKIKSTNTEYEASQTKLYQFGQSLQDNADKWAEHGQKVETAGKTITAASMGIATAAVGAFNEVDEGADAVIRQTGATGDAAEALEASFENVAKQSSADLLEIGNAVGDVNTRFGLTGDALEQTSLQFLRFAENTGVDVNSAIENASMSMKAFGVDSSEAGNVLGMFQTVAQNTGIDVQTLMNDVNANGATFRDMGLNIQDSTALLGSFEAAGVPADQMLTGLKKASANCAKEGTNLGDSLRDLTARLQDPATQAQATQDALDLFGTKAGMAFVDAAESGRVNLDSLGGSLDDYANKVDETFEGTEDAPDKMKESLHSLQIAGSGLGADILDALVPAVSKAADVADRLKEVWDGLSPEQQQLAANVVLGGIAFGGLTSGIGKAMQAADNIGTTFQNVSKFGTTLTGSAGKVSGAFSGLTSVLMANPWVLVVAGIAAVVAGLVWFFTQTEEGRKLWAKFTDFLQTSFGKAKDFIVNAFNTVTGFVKGVPGAITGFFTGIAGWFSNTFNQVKTNITSRFDAARSFVSGIPGAIVGFFAGIGGRISGVVSSVTNAITAPFRNAQATIGSIKDRIVGFFSGMRIRIPSFSWPHITLPHFHINTASIDLGKLGKITYPTGFGVRWYAKGGIIPGTDQPHLIGVGDTNQNEYIIPEDRLQALLARALQMVGGMGGGDVNVEVNVNANVTGKQSSYELGQSIGRGIESTLKQRGIA